MILKLKNLRVMMFLGVFDWEKEAKREVIINLTARFDGTQAIIHDDIEHALDYATLEQYVVSICESKHFNLVETLVDTIGKKVLSKFTHIHDLVVEVDKPGALNHCESVSVTQSFKP